MVELIPDWVDTLRRATGPGEREGSAARIDTEARMRGVAEIREGRSVSLSRPVQSAPDARTPSTCELEATQQRDRRVMVTRDRLTVDSHGVVNTHLNGLSHFAVDDTWHDGTPPVRNADMPGVSDWADTGLVTRAIFLDITAVRGTRWVEAGVPVTAQELDAALARSGVAFESGDALCLYMGRDEYESENPPYGVVPSDDGLRPGIGEDGARWLADSTMSLLLWDLMEAAGPDQSSVAVHALIWACGLILVDHCDMAAARAALAGRRRKAGLLVVAPLMLPQAAGCLVNPLLVI